jgi:hypothetical protein
MLELVLSSLCLCLCYPREAEDADPTQQKANVVNNPLFVDGTFLYVATKV